MSLHKFADMVAKQGRGDDSLLIHMTPDEVQRLQQFAEANGRSLTINPETGLPEAGMLSDLFKAVAPIALGAFLGPGAFGIAGLGLSAGTAGLVTGGLTTLATGSLSRGLMAGLGAYGGAGLAEGLAGAGAGVLGQQASEATAMELANAGAGEALTGEAYNKAFQQSVTDKLAGADTFSAGLNAAKAAPMDFLKQNLGSVSAAAAPIMAGQMVPTTTKMPTETNPAYIRQKLYDPYTQTYKSLAPVKASEWGGRSFSDAYTNPQTGIAATLDERKPTPMNGGGIVALAVGGMPKYAGATNGSVVREDGGVDVGDPILSAYQAGDYATANQLIANAGMNAQDVVNQYGLNQAQAADVAKNLGYTGDMSGTQYGAGFGTTVNDLYKQVLGRDVESEGAAGYWQNQFGDTIDANEMAQFKAAAQAELDARNTGATGLSTLNTGATDSGTSGGLNSLLNTPAYTQYSAGDIQDYIRANKLDASGIATATQQFNADPTKVAEAQNAAAIVNNIYRNVLGRDADPNGLNFWTNEITSGRRTGQEMYQDFLKSAKANTELGKFDMTLEQASTPYKGYMSTDTGNIVDEWVRNTLGREVTDADRQQKWYKDASDKGVMTTYDKAQDIYSNFQNYAYKDAAASAAKQIADAKASLAARGLTEMDVLKQTGKTISELVGSGMNLNADLMKASQLLAPGKKAGFDFSTIQKAKVVPTIVSPNGVIPGGFYGNETNPGDITRNADGTVTVHPNIPYRPEGGFSGMGEVRDAYTRGGGSLGYTAKAPKTIEEFNQLYNKQTGDSLAAYDYLMGKGGAKYPVQSVAASSTEGIMRPYSTGGARYKPRYLSYGKDGEIKSSSTSGTPADVKAGNLTAAKTIEVTDSSGESAQTYTAVLQPDGTYLAGNGKRYDVTGKELAANGGMMGYAVGGGLGSLGSYSDGGRLLKGPGDGVSDSIPATIGAKQQPARLADGEFVIPARIVSELGNGSTDAGARKLYAMMDRVQKARGKTTGKNKVAANTRADKHLPA